MKIPEKVKVGGITYSVKTSDRLQLGNDAIAEIDFNKATIEIWSDIDEQVARRALLHEIVHAIYSNLGYSTHDEKQIDELAGALYQVIVDNEEVFKE